MAIFGRGTLQTPLALLPCPEPSVVTRWCPTIFKLDPDRPSHLTQLQYRMVLGRSSLVKYNLIKSDLAVATSESGIGSVILYETQQMEPIAQIEGMHYANMTDLAWSPDGNHLFVSSRDGYDVIVGFGPL